MPLFTRENAAAMAKLSWESRNARPQANATATLDPAPADAYIADRLSRVRRQLDRIDAMLEAEDDPQRMDRLAAASMRLSDQEFALADRPKPGNRRPAASRPGPKGGVFWGGTAAPAPSAPPSSQSQPAEVEAPENP